MMVGNLTIKDIEEQFEVQFSQEDESWLKEHWSQLADVKGDKWHCFMFPTEIVCGTAEFAKQMFERLKNYPFKGQIKIIW